MISIMKFNKTLIILFIITLFPLIGLLAAGLPVTHDGTDHVARIANFYLSLSEGNIVPRWATNLNWGYGHPILMFLYPLPSYMASAFHALGLSFVDSTKMVFGFSFIASVISMYLWSSRRWGKTIGILISLLYGFSPYRFVDMYVRGAIGEHVAFIFPPLILYFVDSLSLSWNQNSRKAKEFMFGIRPAILLSLCVAGLVLAHNAISLMFLPIIGLYCLYVFIFETKNKLFFAISCVISLCMGFVVSAFYWIPALVEGKYTLRDIVTKGETVSRFVPFIHFFYSPWNYGGGTEFTKSIGVIEWFGFLAALFLFIKEKTQKIRIFMIGIMVLFVFSLVLQTKWSIGIWNAVSIMQKFQFPWRILTISVFLSSIISGWSIGTIIGLWGKKKNTLITVFVCMLIVIPTYFMWFPKDVVIRPEGYYMGVYAGTTDTGESSPIWSTRFMEHFPSNPMDIDKGAVVIEPLKRTSTERKYQITASGSARLVENTLFFPGWTVSVDGVQTGIQYQDPTYRGLMVFWVEDGKHTVDIVFGDTKLRKYSGVISGIGGMILLGMVGLTLWKKRK